MAMDFGTLGEKTLGQVATTLTAEGLGMGVGFLGAGFVGRNVQNLVKKDEAIVSLTDKLLAWGSNNVLKIGIWYALRGYETKVAPGTVMEEITADAKKAVAGSVMLDTLMRLTHKGVNPMRLNLFGIDFLSGKEIASMDDGRKQRLLEENGQLRQLYNDAMKRLTTASTPTVQVQQVPYAAQPFPPGQAERERKHAFMEPDVSSAVTPPAIEARERRYGFASGNEPGSINIRAGFAGEEKSMANMFGML